MLGNRKGKVNDVCEDGFFGGTGGLGRLIIWHTRGSKHISQDRIKYSGTVQCITLLPACSRLGDQLLGPVSSVTCCDVSVRFFDVAGSSQRSLFRLEIIWCSGSRVWL